MAQRGVSVVGPVNFNTMKVVHLVGPVELNIHIIITHMSVILQIDPNANTVAAATITRIRVNSVQPVNTIPGIDGPPVFLVPGVIPPLLERLAVP